jgi:hypothetical protein
MREVTPNTPLNKPFDLTDVNFSPHWSVGKGANWSHTPSPLDLSLVAPSPPIYPSPATQDSGAVTPGFTGEECLSPIRLPGQTQRRNIRSKSYLYPVPQPILSGFSTLLPDALRNVETNISARSAPASVVSTIESSPSGFENDDSLLSVTDVALKDIPEDKRRTLLSKYRKVVSELESSLAFEEIVLGEKDDSFVIQTPPSLRPATFPRVRGDNSINTLTPPAKEIISENSSWAEKDKQTAEPEDGNKQHHNTRDTGIVVTENGHTINYHWEDFDQEFEVVKSPDRLDTEDACTEIWMSKWSQKGVQVMMPVDEESSESNGGHSAKISPVSSRKVVHWVDEVFYLTISLYIISLPTYVYDSKTRDHL